jgi:hypothetical protein
MRGPVDRNDGGDNEHAGSIAISLSEVESNVSGSPRYRRENVIFALNLIESHPAG